MADVAEETQIEVRRIHDVAGEGFHVDEAEVRRIFVAGERFHVDEAEERRILIYVEST
jgi:hypothetical protein